MTRAVEAPARLTRPKNTAGPVEELLDLGARSVSLMITTACNLRCAYCYQRPRTPCTMAPDILDAAIGRLFASRFSRPELTLYGGEPLLAAHLVRRALDRVREGTSPRIRPRVQIVTNGSRLNEKMTQLLVSRGVFITLSFDGVRPAQDHRGPGNFQILDELLGRLRRDHRSHFRRRFGIKATLTARNVPYLAASVRYFLSRGVRDVDVVPVFRVDAPWNEQSVRELDRQIADVVKQSVAEFHRSGAVPFRHFRKMVTRTSGDDSPPCGCGSRDLLFVDVDGTLAPCAALARSTLGSASRTIRLVVEALGGLHVTDRDLSAALGRRERRARRLSFLAGANKRFGPKGPCRRCALRSTCFVCPISVALNNGRVPGFHCDVNRLLARHRTVFQRKTDRVAEE